MNETSKGGGEYRRPERREEYDDGTTVIVRDLGRWTVHTTVDSNGSVVKRVSFPKKPIATEEELHAAVEAIGL